MFSGYIVWRGIVYTTLMVLGKLLCGAWFLRITPNISAPTKLIARLPKVFFSSGAAHFWGRRTTTTPHAPTTESPSAVQSPAAPVQSASECDSPPARTEPLANPSPQHAAPAGANPLSLYPPSIVGCAMTARGEIGFLISSIAESNGIFASSSDGEGESSDIFLVVTWAIVLCTILGPLAVGILVRRAKRLQRGVGKDARAIRRDVLGAWGV